MTHHAIAPQLRHDRALDIVRHQRRSCEGSDIMSPKTDDRVLLVENGLYERHTVSPGTPNGNATKVRAGCTAARAQPKYP